MTGNPVSRVAGLLLSKKTENGHRLAFNKSLSPSYSKNNNRPRYDCDEVKN